MTNQARYSSYQYLRAERSDWKKNNKSKIIRKNSNNQQNFRKIREVCTNKARYSSYQYLRGERSDSNKDNKSKTVRKNNIKQNFRKIREVFTNQARYSSYQYLRGERSDSSDRLYLIRWQLSYFGELVQIELVLDNI